MSKPENVLEVTPRDYVASAAKSVLGAVPFAGSLLVEIAGEIIPNQRLDRIAKFAQELEERMSHLDQQLIRSQLTDENFTDLMEEGIRQAARSVSDERRKYLASVIAGGLTSEDIGFLESKHLLRILGEINDVEVILLRFNLVETLGGDEEFRSKHKDVIKGTIARMQCSQPVLDKAALHDSYKEHLVALSLLERRYRSNMTTGKPEYDSYTNAQEIDGYRITNLGKLLLRKIGLAENKS